MMSAVHYGCLRVPFLLWSIAVIVVYVVSVKQLEGMDTPLASLNMASRVTYRYTRVRAMGAVFVTAPDSVMRGASRRFLSMELDILESEYNALMYGGEPSSSRNSSFNHAVPSGTFASSDFAQVFFRSKGCLRYNQSACLPKGHEYYEVTHNGLDAMVRRLISEMRLLTMDDDADVMYNSTRYMYTAVVGANDLYEGLQQAAELFLNYSISHYEAIVEMHVILLAVSVALVVVFVIFLLWPHLTKTVRDATRQSGLLSLVPPELDVRAHVRTVAKPLSSCKKVAERVTTSR